MKAMPQVETIPELWVLGSSRASAEYAAELGWSFCFAHFISSEGLEDVIQGYEARFQPSPWLPEPRSAIGISVTGSFSSSEKSERAPSK